MVKAAPLNRPAERRLPVVAIAGRPNVGKSTLFNRLVGERKAIVDDIPGVTRDRNYAEAEWGGRSFILVDTGGLDTGADGNLARQIQEQTRLAMVEADVVLLLFDGKAGLNPLDREALQLVRSVNKPVLFAVNKIDSEQRAANLYEFYTLGLEQLHSISAEHGLGVAELLDRVIEQLPAEGTGGAEAEPEEQAPVRLAVVGRPNVGKSTLINRLLGFERSVVDTKPGTTRDALDAPVTLGGEACILVDTAGIRRKARVHERVERFSVNRSLRSGDREVRSRAISILLAHALSPQHQRRQPALALLRELGGGSDERASDIAQGTLARIRVWAVGTPSYLISQRGLAIPVPSSFSSLK